MSEAPRIPMRSEQGRRHPEPVFPTARVMQSREQRLRSLASNLRNAIQSVRGVGLDILDPLAVTEAERGVLFGLLHDLEETLDKLPLYTGVDL